ncbi:MAG TPA: site-2 protease family protein [Chloroflexota bacterium]|nr:site-2 protease family protein [Chloroflexota bacterium]
MIRNSITLGRVAGIAIGVHYTWLFIAALISWSLAQGYFPATYPGWSPATYWLAGIAAALALFASVLIHELGHSLVAISRGVPVISITLFIFGGVATMREEADSPGDEFLIAAAGPVTSFVLAGAFWAMSTVAPTGSPAEAVTSYLAGLNGFLGGFNLLPGFPLDGGRVLRSIIWGVSGSLRRATQLATYVGQGIGFLMIFWGLSQALAGAFLNGLWIAFIGWFLNGAAEQTRQAQELKSELEGIGVAEVMDPQPAVATPSMSVEELVYHYVLRQGRRALPVVSGGQVVGLVSITDAREVPQADWRHTTVEQVMTRSPLKTVSPSTGLDTAMHLLVEGNLNQLPVVEGGVLVGMITRADILRYLQVRHVLGLRTAGREAWRHPNAA